VLAFARGQKKRNNVAVPFTYLGPVEMVSYECERPIKMVWRLKYGMMGVSDSYSVITSRQIAADPNVSGFILTLNGRGIIPPADHDFWPAQLYLAEHRREWRL